jgi:hypothetical protein
MKSCPICKNDIEEIETGTYKCICGYKEFQANKKLDNKTIEKEANVNSVETLIYLQRDIIKNAKTVKGFTDYDLNTLSKALMVLEKLKLQL